MISSLSKKSSDEEILELVKKARAGEEKAFEALYRRYQKMVLAICMKMLKNQADAEDCAQKTFCAVWEKIPTFRGESYFATWLYRIAINVVLIHLRLRKTRREAITISLEELKRQPANEFMGIIIQNAGGDGQNDPEPRKSILGRRDAYLESIPLKLTLQSAIGKLPPGYKNALILHDVNGCDHQEIARMLGCSSGNSKSQLYKAHRKLRGLIASGKIKPGTFAAT